MTAHKVLVTGAAVQFDVTDLDACMRACAGVHTVLHLAADPLPDADFHASLLPTNIIGTYNMVAFISERDVVHLLARCIDADLRGFTVVHGVSDNRYKRLAIEQTRRALDYRPRDDAFTLLEGEAGAPA